MIVQWCGSSLSMVWFWVGSVTVYWNASWLEVCAICVKNWAVCIFAWGRRFLADSDQDGFMNLVQKCFSHHSIDPAYYDILTYGVQQGCQNLAAQDPWPTLSLMVIKLYQAQQLLGWQQLLLWQIHPIMGDHPQPTVPNGQWVALLCQMCNLILASCPKFLVTLQPSSASPQLIAWGLHRILSSSPTDHPQSKARPPNTWYHH